MKTLLSLSLSALILTGCATNDASTWQGVANGLSTPLPAGSQGNVSRERYDKGYGQQQQSYTVTDEQGRSYVVTPR